MLFMLSYLGCQAQVPNFNEFFKQKKTQRKYLIKQIALLKLYLGYVKKGYDIAGKGLNAIADIKDGTFDLDKDYLNALGQVSPVVKNSPKIHDILSCHDYIKSAFRELYEDCRGDENLSTAEIRYIKGVYLNILRECSASLDELDIVITAGETEMNDDERLQRLDKVYRDMMDIYLFTQDFVVGTRMLRMERAREAHQITRLRNLHTIE